MGKKRIINIGTEEVLKKKTGLPGETREKRVKSGKEHGRIADMGMAALEEAEKIKAKEEKLEKETIGAAKKSLAQKRPAKKRGQRYLRAKKQIDPAKRYPLSEAIELVKKTSIARFNGKIELHLVLKEKINKRTINLPHPLPSARSGQGGKETKLVFATEKKDPLIHLVIGKVDTKDSDLGENFQTIISAIGPKNIRKAVLTSTMGPGVKVDPSST